MTSPGPAHILTRCLPSARTIVIAMLLTAGCTETVASVPYNECVSELKWVGGDRGSPLMRPGRDCIDCHRRTGGPFFVVAGTVYPSDGVHDPVDCYGLEGATVHVQDAAGKEIALETNGAGNFFLDHRSGSWEFPLTLEVESDGDVRPMVMAADSGDCSSCHSAAGANGAPGRILAP